MPEPKEQEKETTGLAEEDTKIEAPAAPSAPVSGDPADDDDEYEDYVPGRIQLFFEWVLKHKKKTFPVLLAILIAVIFIVPASRYKVLGLAMKSSITFVVVDEQSNLPVSEAEVIVNGQTFVTNAEGRAQAENTKVGYADVGIYKKYYNDFQTSVLIPLREGEDIRLTIAPNGRQVPVKVTNTITGKPIAGAVLTALDTKVKTDENGEATLVLPPENDEVEGLLNSDGYNQSRVKIKVSHLAIKDNTYQLTPSGKVYFLSKQTGSINVMKANLDGSEATVAVKASGSEQDNTTKLVPTPDWKYIALKARREGDQARIYLLNPDNDGLVEIDGDNNTEINIIGWQGNTLVYEVYRLNRTFYQSKNYALKTYNAETGVITVIKENEASGDQYNYQVSRISNVMLSSGYILYSTTWSSRYESDLESKKASLTAVQTDGSNKRTIKDFAATKVNYINGVAIDLERIFYRVDEGGKEVRFAVIRGELAESVDASDELLDKQYPIIFVSPSSKSTLWAENRDGKQTLIVGDEQGINGNEILKQSNYAPYAWFTDNYIIVSKENQLFSMPSNGVGSTGAIIMISSYHAGNYFRH